MIETNQFSDAIFNKTWFLGKSDGSAKFYTSDNPVVLLNKIDVSDIRGTLGLNSRGIEIYLPLNDNMTLCLFCEKISESFKGKDTPIINYNIDYITELNYLQYMESTRFIFSSIRNFEMIENEFKQ